MSQARKKGALQILLSGACFGFLGVFGKRAYDAGVTPGELLSLRFDLAAGFLWTYLLIFKRGGLRLPRRVIGGCAALGILGYAVFASCYFEALSRLSASLTVLLLYTYPVLVCLGAWRLFGERPRARQLLALPLAATGLGLLLSGHAGAGGTGVGILFGLGSSVFYSLYILASSRILRGVDPLVSVAWIQTFAGGSLSLVHFDSLARPLAIVGSVWPALLGISLVSSVAAMVLFLSGLQKLRSAEVSILSTSEPVTAVLAAGVFLGERSSVAQLAGAGLVLGAMLLATQVTAVKDAPFKGAPV